MLIYHCIVLYKAVYDTILYCIFSILINDSYLINGFNLINSANLVPIDYNNGVRVALIDYTVSCGIQHIVYP